MPLDLGIPIDKLFPSFPSSLRDELLTAYSDIVRNYRERRWEPSELNGGKLCEVVYSIIKGYIDGNFPTNTIKPKNMVEACLAIEQTAPALSPRSIRIQLPRMLMALYETRNNRGVGHIGGDINPNHMDATCVLYMSKWIVAELIRVFHAVDTKIATDTVDAIVERISPVIWEVGDKKRVLDTTLTMKEKTLLILSNSQEAIAEKDLVEWIEHSNPSIYRRDVLRQLHKAKLVEYDSKAGLVYISPKGIAFVEENILRE
jgi:hypothetical protein